MIRKKLAAAFMAVAVLAGSTAVPAFAAGPAPAGALDQSGDITGGVPPHGIGAAAEKNAVREPPRVHRVL